jgi:hypothetical protein
MLALLLGGGPEGMMVLRGGYGREAKNGRKEVVGSRVYFCPAGSDTTSLLSCVLYVEDGMCNRWLSKEFMQDFACSSETPPRGRR